MSAGTVPIFELVEAVGRTEKTKMPFTVYMRQVILNHKILTENKFLRNVETEPPR